jgi:hypothetical protein
MKTYSAGHLAELVFRVRDLRLDDCILKYVDKNISNEEHRQPVDHTLNLYVI